MDATSPPKEPWERSPYKGAALLHGWMTRNGLTYQDVADLLPSPAGQDRTLSKTPVIGWVRHGQRPDRETQDSLEKVTDGEVPADAWLAEGERRPVDRATRFVPPAPTTPDAKAVAS